MDQDACAKHSLTCPITTGSTYLYANSIFCEEIYPKVYYNGVLFHHENMPI